MMKYIRVMMLALLTLSGNRVVGQTFNDPFAVSSEYTHNRYLKISEASNTPLITFSDADYEIILENIAEQNNEDKESVRSKMSDKDSNYPYIRWFLSKESVIQDMTKWTLRCSDDDNFGDNYPYGNSVVGYWWAAKMDNWDSRSIRNVLNLQYITPSNSGESLTDYTVHCVISDNAENIDVSSWGSFSGTEPTLKSHFIWQFTETGEAPIVDNFSNVPSDVITVTQTVSINEALSPTSVSITLKDATVPSYIRWYFADASGNAVANPGFTLSNEGYSYTSQDNSIYYGGTTTEANADLLNMTVTPQSGKSWNDLASYKLVALLSNAAGTTDEGGALTQEPLIATKYEISFEVLSFVGSTGNATSLSETVRLEDEAKSSVTLSLPLSKVEGSLLNEASSFYIRYYLTDKDGNRVALPTGVTITPLNSSITLTSNNYGQYWYSFTGIGSITDLGVTVADANSTVDLRNYNVVAVMSSNDPHEVSDGKVVYEPRQLEVVYTFNLEAPIGKDFDGNLASGGVTKTITKVIPEGQDRITLTDVLDDWDNLKDLFEPNSNYVTNSPNGAKTPRYRRVYVRYKKELLNWIEHTDGEHFNVSDYGHIWTANYDVYKYPYANYYCWFVPKEAKFLTTTVQVPANSDIKLSDVEVVFILAKGDAREETLDNWTITKGPEEHEVEYVFKFMSEKYLPFVHYKGVTGRDWKTVSSNPLLGKFENQAYDATTDKTTVVKDDIRQGTHEWAYEVYVEPGETKVLALPVEDVFGYGNPLEPQGYFRWYDWESDFESHNIVPYDADNTLLRKRFYQQIDDGELSRGLIAWWWGNTQTNATAKNVAAVRFTAPNDGQWTGETVACDVSKYTDGLEMVTENNQTTIDFVHEPTLSYRYKYIIRPASVIANAIDEALAQGSVLENHGNVTIGIYSLENTNGYWERGGTTTLRLERNSVGHYYFNTANSERLQATSLEWSIYNAAGTKVTDLPPVADNQTFCKFAYSSSYNIGEFYTIKVHACANDASGTKQMKEIAQFNCKFLDNSYVMAFDDVPTNRSIEYMEEHYTRVGLISFDIEEGSTLNEPTDQLDNINSMPFQWERSHYGYCYGQLYGQMAGQASEYAGLGALHGDYRLIKSANVVAKDKTELWHVSNVLHDRTYASTNGSQHGYFLYIDASDESRPIANVEFEGEMCVGSTLMLSAAVADMTGATVKPQLIFKLYGIDEDVAGNETERKLIHSFATCDFNSVKAAETGTWYQTFAKVILQKNTGVENYQHFLVSIDNYCDGTDGADYAIDDIRVYVQNAKAEVVQEKVACGEEKIETGIRMPHETLLAVLPTFSSGYMPIYYRICTKEGTPLTETDFYGKGQNNYGVAYIRRDFYDSSSDNTWNEDDTKLMTELGFTDDEKIAAWFAHHYQKGALGNHQVMLTDADQTFALDAGKEYYVSLTTPKVVDGNYVPDEDNWGNPSNVCSMYSKVFTPLKQSMKLLVGGEAISTINVNCGSTQTPDDFYITANLQIPDASTGGFVDIKDATLCKFDWYVERKDEENLNFTNELKSALKNFRAEYPEATELQGATGKFTEDNYKLLNEVINRGGPMNTSGKLYLYSEPANQLKGPVYQVGYTYIITAIPITETITYDGVEYDICPEPMEVTVEARLNGPELKLGFDNVNYPTDLPLGANVLRVGLAQLENMQTNNIPLHLPVFGYKDMNKAQVNPLLLDEFGLMVVDTNDPTWQTYMETDIAVYRLGSGVLEEEDMHEITAANNSVEIYFHPNWYQVRERPSREGSWVDVQKTEFPVKFHEGYWYEVSFRYIDKTEYESKAPQRRCYGEAYFTIKVVPEYITWGDGLPNNSNWLNDDNWTRSTKEELYKVDYVNNGEGALKDLVENGKATDFAYVPMKFSKVTILGDRQTPYPYLSHLTPNVHSGIIDKQYMYNGDNSAPTTNIEYDMMVKVNPGQCPNDETKTNVYECERFYGNICKEIYFKPRAQLRNQHYLTYDKAWVEMELESNRWNMLAAPLMKVYAGDFYVPKADGRQETEAFKAITFAEAEHSRNVYPFYQRSWDKAQSMVIVPDGDERGNYDAFIDYDWADKDMEVAYTQWSHAYNDVTEHYEPGKGFSLKAHHTEQKNNTLIRLPKADASYTYYNYEDGAGHKVDIDTTKQHRLAADGVATGMLKVTLAPNENETDNLYYLVGNPYMASLKMSSFFNTNSHLSKTYWVVVKNQLASADETSGLGLVGPLQSFFVKNANGSPVESVTFSPAMTVSHLATATTSADTGSESLLAFTTRATADIPAAQTRVILSTDADNGFVDEEDVETLLDSNLEDVPMVYTVAGTQAAMVNRLSDLTLLPLGVFGKEGITETVTVNGVDGFDQPLYLYDAVTRIQTPLEEGAELILTVGEHGRYFITTRAIGAPAEDEAEAWTVRAYSLQQGRLVVAAMPDDCLRRVQVYATNGTLVTDDVPADRAVTEYTLPAGTYVVKVETQHTAGSPHTLKVVVR